MEKSKNKPNILNRKIKLKNTFKPSNFSKDENKRFLITLNKSLIWFDFSDINSIIKDKDNNIIKVLDKSVNNNHLEVK